MERIRCARFREVFATSSQADTGLDFATRPTGAFVVAPQEAACLLIVARI